MCVQIAFAVTSAGSSLYLASKSGEAKNVYLAAGIAMAAMLPFTLIFLIPTNNRLLSAEKKEDHEVMARTDKICNIVPLHIAFPLQSRAIAEVGCRQAQLSSHFCSSASALALRMVSVFIFPDQAALWQVGKAACSAHCREHPCLHRPDHCGAENSQELIWPTTITISEMFLRI